MGFSVFINCKTQKVATPNTVCPDLDTLFPISSYRGNYEYYLDLNKFYKVSSDSTNKNYNNRGEKIEYGVRRIDNDSLFLYINQGIGSFQYNYVVPDLLFISRDLDTDIELVYKIKKEPFLLSEKYIKKYGNSNVFIGESSVIRGGQLFKSNYDKDFMVCVDAAIAIAEQKTLKDRGSIYFQDMRIMRSEPFQKPFWIFIVETNYGKKYYYTVDGITGKFEKADFMKIFPRAVRVPPKAAKNNRSIMRNRKDSIDKILNQIKQ